MLRAAGRRTLSRRTVVCVPKGPGRSGEGAIEVVHEPRNLQPGRNMLGIQVGRHPSISPLIQVRMKLYALCFKPVLERNCGTKMVGHLTWLRHRATIHPSPGKFGIGVSNGGNSGNKRCEFGRLQGGCGAVHAFGARQACAPARHPSPFVVRRLRIVTEVTIGFLAFGVGQSVDRQIVSRQGPQSKWEDRMLQNNQQNTGLRGYAVLAFGFLTLSVIGSGCRTGTNNLRLREVTSLNTQEIQTIRREGKDVILLDQPPNNQNLR
jgi:hypothetical protein